MSKKIVSVILSLCIIVCALPMNILAAPEQNETLTFEADGLKTLLLQNDYISFYFYDLQYQTYTATVPRAIAKETGEVFTQDIQAPDCQLNVYTGGGNKKTIYPFITLQKAEFVSETPNGKNNAIKAEYNMEIGSERYSPELRTAQECRQKQRFITSLYVLTKRIKRLGAF